MQESRYHKGGSEFATVQVWDSVHELGRDFAGAKEFWDKSKNKWFGADNEQAVSAMLCGNKRYAERIEAMFEQLDLPDIEARRKVKKRCAVGPVVNTTQALLGNPIHQMRKEKVRDTMAPLTVVFDCTVSGGINASTMERRGAATLSIVKQLQQVRPVQLWVVGGMKSSGKTGLFGVRLDTDPVDSGRAGWMLCSPAVLRRVMFTMVYRLGGNVNGAVYWAFSNYNWQAKHLAGVMADYVGYDEAETLTLGPRYLDAGDFADDAAAKQWVRDTVAKYEK